MKVLSNIKSKWEIFFQIFMAFSEYLNFKGLLDVNGIWLFSLFWMAQFENSRNLLGTVNFERRLGEGGRSFLATANTYQSYLSFLHYILYRFFYSSNLPIQFVKISASQLIILPFLWTEVLFSEVLKHSKTNIKPQKHSTINEISWFYYHIKFIYSEKVIKIWRNLRKSFDVAY